MSNTVLKDKAFVLRKQGQSIGDIANLLGVSKSTVSGWCKDITLTNLQIERISYKGKERSIKALLKYQEINRQKRKKKILDLKDEGKKDVGELSNRDLYILGLGLYWAEGYKKGNEELGFTNSDPLIVKTFIKWLKDNFGIDDKRFILRISINEQHKYRELKVINYWAVQIKIPANQFTKTSFVKTKTTRQYVNHDDHFGTLRVKVRKATDLRRKIIGSIGALSEKFGR